ncbi:MAG TPA: HEAT repeat domain-containing protein [Ktedonobacteraceae bacterium]|jgi:HEAT repeat protein
MSNADANQEPGKALSSLGSLRHIEQVLAAIVLLLGAKTSYRKRLQASQFLAASGPDILPLLLRMLHHYPEITTPPWPWWPPQYEQIGRLFLHLSQAACIPLADLLHAPYLTRPPGPVLWTGVMEAVRLLPQAEDEPLLLAGLDAPWWTVRYAAATAVANRAGQLAPTPQVRQALSHSQHSDPATPVRLAACRALVRCADERGLQMLIQLLEQRVPPEVRKAAAFLLATEPIPPGAQIRERLERSLLQVLQDSDPQVTLYAACALRTIADAQTLPALASLLEHPCVHVRQATLTALEELAGQATLRRAMQHQLLPQRIASLLHAREPELRSQSCCTLAALGGEYATAVLGTTVLDDLHPAHQEAIEALRLLPEIHCPSVTVRVTRWLLHALDQPLDLVRVSALDSLAHIAWRARTHQRGGVARAMGAELWQCGCLPRLLACTSARVRLRTLELLLLLDPHLELPHAPLLDLLLHDSDSAVRACVARLLGQVGALWAISDLLKATQHSEDHVAEAALDALGAMPLLDDTLLTCAFKELAAYHLPIGNLQQGRRQIHLARTWLKKRAARTGQKAG